MSTRGGENKSTYVRTYTLRRGNLLVRTHAMLGNQSLAWIGLAWKGAQIMPKTLKPDSRLRANDLRPSAN